MKKKTLLILSALFFVGLFTFVFIDILPKEDSPTEIKIQQVQNEGQNEVQNEGYKVIENSQPHVDYQAKYQAVHEKVKHLPYEQQDSIIFNELVSLPNDQEIICDSSENIVYATYNENDKSLIFHKNKTNDNDYPVDLNPIDQTKLPSYYQLNSVIEKIVFTEDIQPVSTYYWFSPVKDAKKLVYLSSNLKSIEGLEHLDMSKCVNSSHMFAGCNNEKFIINWDYNKIQMPKVRNAEGMFQASSVNDDNVYQILKSLYSSEASITGLFASCKKINTVDFKDLTYNHLSAAQSLFYDCTNLSNFINLDKVKFYSNFEYDYFFAKTGVENLDLLGFFVPQNGKKYEIESLFEDCDKLRTLNMADWDTFAFSGPTENVFKGCKQLMSFTIGEDWTASMKDYGLAAPDKNIIKYADGEHWFKKDTKEAFTPDKINSAGTYNARISDFIYNISKEGLICVGYDGYDTNIEIPEVDKDRTNPNDFKPVVGIGNGNNPISLSKTVKSVSFKNAKNITKISDYAFKNKNSIETVILGNAITELGEGAFYACKKLSSIDFNQGLNIIGNKCFINTGFSRINIPKNINKIGNEAFESCQLKYIVLETDNYNSPISTEIGNRAFANCSKLNTFIVQASDSNDQIKYGSDVFKDSGTAVFAKVGGTSTHGQGDNFYYYKKIDSSFNGLMKHEEYYYFTSDITLSDAANNFFTENEGVGKFALDLNGYALHQPESRNNFVIEVRGQYFRIDDSSNKGNGSISGGNTNQDGKGGGIHVACNCDNTKLDLVRGNIVKNSAAQGGGILFVNKKNDPKQYSATFTMYEGSINENTATATVSGYEFVGGGAIKLKDNVEFIMNGGTISENKTLGQSNTRGAAIFISGSSSMLMNDGYVINNTLTKHPESRGGIKIDGSFSTSENVVPYNPETKEGNYELEDSVSVSGKLILTHKEAAKRKELEAGQQIVFKLSSGKTFSAITDQKGNFEVSGIPNGSSGVLSANVPGYTGESIELEKLTESVKDKNLNETGPALDNYTLDALNNAANDLYTSGNKSQYYDEFYEYMKKDEIWYSNSNSKQPKEVYDNADTTKIKPELCNQNYKNNFDIDYEHIPTYSTNLDRFMFLRIVGINQDKITGQSKTAGITFQTIRSLPHAYAYNNGGGVAWYGADNCTLRSDLNSGSIYSKLCDGFKTAIVPVDKKTESNNTDKTGADVKTLSEKMFIPSYSEMTTPGSEHKEFKNYAYYINNGEGNQYQWYALKQVMGGNPLPSQNKCLSKLGLVNSGESASATGQSYWLTRSCYCNKGGNFLLVNQPGYLFNYTASESPAGIAPCFCLGGKPVSNTVSISGSLDLDNVESSVREGTTDNKTITFNATDSMGAQHSYTAVTDLNGNYKITGIPKGSFGDISAKVEGYTGSKQIVEPLSGNTTINLTETGPHFDNYTLDELRNIANDISDNNVKSDYYPEFQAYMNNNEIWYSNSNSQQTDELDSKLCNQDYKCNFNDDKEINNFIFLKVIGVCHDTVADSQSKTGLTFQVVNALPIASKYEGSNWQDSKLRQSLQYGGDIYTKFNTQFTSKMTSVNKQFQQTNAETANIASTKDSMFIPSYSEIWNKNNAFSPAWYGNTGINTEGQLYSWYKQQDINGSENNPILNSVVKNNNGDSVANKAVLRSLYFNNVDNFVSIDAAGNPNTKLANNEDCALTPAFCFGGESALDKVTIYGTLEITNKEGMGRTESAAGKTIKFGDKSTTVNNDGTFKFEDIAKGSSGTVDVDIIGYSGDQVKIDNITRSTVVNLKQQGPALDNYTIDELKSVSEDISSNPNSIYLTEFNNFMKNDEIWYSNSNCKQTDVINPELCNQNYKCNFKNVDTEHMGDNFISLRVIGIKHDIISGSNKRAGLTFQLAHVLPIETIASSGSNQWWGDAGLRDKLQENGEVFVQFNNTITSKIVAVDKTTQTKRDTKASLQVTSDKLFLPSYSELWAVPGSSSLVKNAAWYGNTGINTEGNTYEWFKAHNIDGASDNSILAKLHYTNTGRRMGDKGATWERSILLDDNPNYFLAISENGALTTYNFNFNTAGLAPCFCF